MNDANVAGLSRRWQDAAIGARANDDKENPRAAYAEGRTQPRQSFRAPDAGCAREGSTTAEKRAILRSWETDARALQRADDEGMQVGERSRLHDVEIALACLDAQGK